MKRLIQYACVVLMNLLLTTTHAVEPEKTHVNLSVGGPIMNFLPLPLTTSLGYFKQEGLNVTVESFSGGSKALQALIAGSTDAVVGFYDHTIQMQAQGKEIVGVILLNTLPGVVIGTRSDLNITAGKDLKGLKIGITTPGSSTDIIARYYIKHNGLSLNEVSFIAVSSGMPGMVALERKRVDVLIYADPVATLLDQHKTAKILADARNITGTKALFGGNYPTACLYMTREFIDKNPETVQRLVNAFARTLRWINKNSPEAITDKIPKNAQIGGKTLFIGALRNSKAIFSVDGLFNEQDMQTSLKVLRSYDEKIAKANIDIKKTFTNQFVLNTQKILNNADDR